MKFLKIFFLSAMIAGLYQNNLWSQKEIRINYFKPYIYDIPGNSIKAWIDGNELGRNFTISLDGKNVSWSASDSGRVALTLPLAGKPCEMVITRTAATGNKEVIKQIFKPQVSADWGYFGKGTVNIICSSHQDIAWMNTPDSCRDERIHKIILPALDMIEKNPAFKFEMEQTLNLMELLDAVPSEKQRIIDAYKSGQFSWGATFNQPYEGLESGEQLVRQSYLGRRWIKETLPGMDAVAAYNVDVPGRTLQAPQIFASSGIKYLFVSRMKEGFCNWYSPDGSRILTYSPGNYGWALLVYQYFEGDVITALQKLHDVLSNWNDYYRDHNLPPHYAVIISTDAGGPKDYSKIIGEWNAIARSSGCDIPLVQHATAEEFLGKIDVPGIKPDSIYGERPDLWLYIHGPAHYEAISAKKSAAVTLPAAEIFSSVDAMIKGSMKNYPSAKLNSGWYKSIYPDHGWGGKHGEITDSIFRAALEEGDETGRMLTKDAVESIASRISIRNSGGITVFNDLSWSRTGYVNISIPGSKGAGYVITDGSGKIIPAAVAENNSGLDVRFLANVPSMGYKTFYVKKGPSAPARDVKVVSNYYENSFYKIEFGNGGIKSLYDKQLGRELFNTSKYSGGDILSIGYDGNGAGEFVQIKPVNFTDYEPLSTKECLWQLKENNDVNAVFESVSRLRNFTVRQTITVYHDQKQIDFEYDIPDWPGEHNRQLRVAFPLSMKDAGITYDVPMGILNVGSDEMKKAPFGWSWEGTYSQLPVQIHPREIENFLSASDSRAGVTISTDLAVADWIDPGREAVSYPVLQCILLSAHKSCHYLGNWYHQTGSHHFRISLTSHNPGWKNGYHFGVEGNHPFTPVVQNKTHSGILPEELSFLSVSSPFVRVTGLKKSESGNSLILRMVEMEGKDEKPTISTYFPIKKLVKTNLIEEKIKDIGQSGKSLEVDLGKNSIGTYRLEF